MSKKRKERRDLRRRRNRHKYYAEWDCFIGHMNFNLVLVGITGLWALSLLFLVMGLFVGTIQYEIIPRSPTNVVSQRAIFFPEKTNLIPQPMTGFVTCTMNDRTYWHSKYDIRNSLTLGIDRIPSSLNTTTYESACEKDSSSPLCRPYRLAPGIWTLSAVAIYLHLILWIGIIIPITKHQTLKNLVMFSSLILLLIILSTRLALWNTKSFYSPCTTNLKIDPFPFVIQHNSTLTNWTQFRYDSRLLGFQSANFIMVGFMLVLYSFGVLMANDEFSDAMDNGLVVVFCFPFLLLFFVGILVSAIFGAMKDIACIVQGAKWDIVSRDGDCTFCQHRTEPWFRRLLCWPLFLCTFACRKTALGECVGHTDGPLDDYVEPPMAELTALKL